METSDQRRPPPSPRFYKIISLAFFVIGVVLIWVGFRSHDKVLWIFAAITLLNSGMAALKSLVVRETGHS
jgi:hypothetical protein